MTNRNIRKTLITDDVFTCKKLYSNKSERESYHFLWMNTNHKRQPFIGKDKERFLMIEAGNRREPEFYEEATKYLESDTAWQKFYRYLLQRKINLKDIYQIMYTPLLEFNIQAVRKPLNRFCLELISCGYMGEFKGQYPYTCQASVLYTRYKEWCESQGEIKNLSLTRFGEYMSDICDKRIGSGKKAYYFASQELITEANSVEQIHSTSAVDEKEERIKQLLKELEILQSHT